MIEDIVKYQKTNQVDCTFSVLIPSWNNLEYLKVCIHSILKNSHFKLQIIVIVNEGSDGTIEWIENQDSIDYVHSKTNIGICYALNITRSLIKSDYIVYVNDDMYMLPDWDLVLYKEIELIGHKEFMLSSTMIEPNDIGNPCVIAKDYGHTIADFKEDLLLKEFTNLYTNDWTGSTWPPVLLHLDMWDLVGGMSIEFSPGMYSDPDLSKKLFKAGVRLFKGKGNSLVYHFGSKSIKRIKQNKGKKMFLLKWGLSSRTFTWEVLKRGSPFNGDIKDPKFNWMTRLLYKLKRMKSCW